MKLVFEGVFSGDQQQRQNNCAAVETRVAGMWKVSCMAFIEPQVRMKVNSSENQSSIYGGERAERC
jgi:hypothetical protein